MIPDHVNDGNIARLKLYRPLGYQFTITAHSYRVVFEGKLVKAFALKRQEHQRTSKGIKASLRKMLDEAVLAAEIDWRKRSKDEES